MRIVSLTANTVQIYFEQMGSNFQSLFWVQQQKQTYKYDYAVGIKYYHSIYETKFVSFSNKEFNWICA